ncbi:MAG: M18 family aminopeptidase, partial [Actinobacteria bacterium]|nr:M18 family aminopeptidase [Actinomycetota bacterium]
MTSDLVTQVRNQLDASPTARHLVDFVAKQLSSAGFTDCAISKSSEGYLSSGFIERSGSIVAWRRGSKTIDQFRIIGAHTDSPCLK